MKELSTIDTWWEGWRERANQRHSYLGGSRWGRVRHHRFPTLIVARGGKCRVARNNDVGQHRHRCSAVANIRFVLFCRLVSRRAYPDIDHTAVFCSRRRGEWRKRSP